MWFEQGGSAAPAGADGDADGGGDNDDDDALSREDLADIDEGDGSFVTGCVQQEAKGGHPPVCSKAGGGKPRTSKPSRNGEDGSRAGGRHTCPLCRQAVSAVHLVWE